MVAFLQRNKRIVSIIIYNIMKLLMPVNNNKILMISTNKGGLSVNLEYLYKYIKTNKKKYKIVTHTKLSTKPDVKTRIQRHFKLLKHIATAKYILIDDFYPLIYTFKIRKGVKFVQVWHALGAFKRVGFSRIGKVGGPSENSLTHKNYTDAIVSSKSIIKNYAEAFGIDKSKVHDLGTPRTDMFFDEAKMVKIANKIKKDYNLKTKKVILFAPTFRGNGLKSAHYPKKFIDFEQLYNELNDEYVVLIKYHPFTKNKDNSIFDKYKGFYIDMNNYSDINELLLVTDVLITDYSSVIFDYSLLEKSVVFYIPDFDNYVDTRSFYYDFKEYMYGKKAYNMDELVSCIKNGKVNQKVLNKFKKKFLSAIDGECTKKIADYYFK